MVVDVSGLADADPLCAYLSGFAWLMAGDLDLPRARLNQLAGVEEGPIPEMRQALAGMVARADALLAAGVRLDERALTAWHAVIQGSILLHESPHGHDEPMHGRYAFVADGPGLMREGIERLASVLATRDRPVQQVVAAPDRASRILALAVGERLGLPVVPWSGAPHGVVVAWTMESVGDPEFYRSMHAHRADQVLFAHASSWVQPFPYAPDVTTYLHQVVTHPFTGGALVADPDGGGVTESPADLRSDEELARVVLDAAVADPSVSGLMSVVQIAKALEGLPSAYAAGLHRVEGLRHRQRAGSPVPSARFG